MSIQWCIYIVINLLSFNHALIHATIIYTARIDMTVAQYSAAFIQHCGSNIEGSNNARLLRILKVLWIQTNSLAAVQQYALDLDAFPFNRKKTFDRRRKSSLLLGI